MKYDNQITELKNLLPNVKNILIVLPSGADIDRLAAGLALYLCLFAASKKVSLACEDIMKVGQSHLFGIDRVQKSISGGESGNLILTLEGVTIDSNGTVPALQNLDWYPEGNDKLNLVFHVVPGQTFQPSRIVPSYSNTGYDLIFVLGSATLSNLGTIYSNQTQIFSNVHIVNIDNGLSNTNFGQTNIVDSMASGVCEMVVDLIPSLGIALDGDSASNLIEGIFESTGSLTDPKVTADTFMAVVTCLRAGGKKPVSFGAPTGQGLDLSGLIPSQSIPTTPSTPVIQEERPQGEGLASPESIEPEPGWLTPKVFKGTSVG